MFYKFKKGSQEARDHMAKIRAMRGKKKRSGNPLTRRESAQVIRASRGTARRAKEEAPGSFRKGMMAGAAMGMADVVSRYGPPQGRRVAKRFQEKQFGRNPPLLILGNPGKKRRKVVRAPRHSSFGECPKGFPMKIWRDPAFQRERKVFQRRHGFNTPIHINVVRMPPGSPRFMSAYGKSTHAVYDAPKASKRGKFLHHFGKGGKNKPWLVSSVQKGPRWLGFAGGTFKARTKWLYD